MKIKLAMGAMTAVLFAAPVAYAAPEMSNNPAELDFTVLDADQDGQVSQSEFLSKNELGTEIFSIIDADQSGDLSKEELTSYKTNLKHPDTQELPVKQ